VRYPLAEASRTLDPEGKQRLLHEFADRRVEASEKTLRRCTRRAGRRLRKVQDKLGELNDVVASENLLRGNAALLGALGNAESTLAWFRKERKRRMRAAASILRKIQ